MFRTVSRRWPAIAVLAFGWTLDLSEGEAAAATTQTAVAVPAAMTVATSSTGDWQARLSSKVLEWMGETDLDFGFSIAYVRRPDHPGSIVGPFNDGRGLATDPAAFLNFPSQSNLDLGLRIFLDQMQAKNGSIEAVVQALEQQGTVRMLAEPTLVLKRGAGEATVRTGTRIPYAAGQIAGLGVAEVTLFQDTGVALKVSFMDVAKLDDNYALMKVIADVSSLAGFVAVSLDPTGAPRRVPQINTRSIESTILVRDKTTLIAGVIKEDSDTRDSQGPPILGDIPLIKYFFRNWRSVTKTHEILFLINVDLIPPGTM